MVVTVAADDEEEEEEEKEEEYSSSTTTGDDSELVRFFFFFFFEPPPVSVSVFLRVAPLGAKLAGVGAGDGGAGWLVVVFVSGSKHMEINTATVMITTL